MSTERRNPFEELGLSPNATGQEIERAAQRQLAMIRAGIAEDSSEEAAFRVRNARDALRDPKSRLIHEAGTFALSTDDLMRDLPSILEETEAVLPDADPTTSALAEEILWELLGPLDEPSLEPDHARRREQALTPREGRDDTPLLNDIDFGEIVRFRFREKPEKNRKGKKVAK